MKKILGALGALSITIIGGVAVYWFTTGIQHDRDRRDKIVETQRQRDDEYAKSSQMSEQEPNINRNGFDYKDFVAEGIEACLNACKKESQCKAITFTKSSRQCWMKSSVPARTDDNNYISGVKVGE
jgi:uncharacterized protein YxeA